MILNSNRMISPALQEQINEFSNQLSSSLTLDSQSNDEIQTMKGSLSVAKATVEILKRIVSQATWSSANDLMQILRAEGRLMVARAGIHDLVVGNMVRRVLKTVREEYQSASIHPLSNDPNNVGFTGQSRDSELLQHATSKEEEISTEANLGNATGEGDQPESLQSYMSGPGSRQMDEFNKIIPDLGERLFHSIDELAGELDSSSLEIVEQGKPTIILFYLLRKRFNRNPFMLTASLINYFLFQQHSITYMHQK